MLYHIFKLLVIALVFGGNTASAQAPVNSLVSRRFTEYLMPAAEQTHEFARVPNSNVVLLSQMSDSELIKIELDPATEGPIAFQSFPMGKNSHSGLHGVWPSTVYPGMMWLSLQFDNQLLLVDPGQDLSTAPSIIQIIDIAAPGNGPHCVFEIGNRYYVFSADVSNPTDQALYQCLDSHVFINEEPITSLIYIMQDSESSIMRIDVTSGKTAQLPIPPSVGNTAVGMTTAYGPMNGVWFTLTGNSTGGTGAFGHIGSSGELEFFQLKHPPLR